MSYRLYGQIQERIHPVAAYWSRSTLQNGANGVAKASNTTAVVACTPDSIALDFSDSKNSENVLVIMVVVCQLLCRRVVYPAARHTVPAPVWQKNP